MTQSANETNSVNWHIYNVKTGASLGIYAGETMEDAYSVLACEAGLGHWTDLSDDLRCELATPGCEGTL